MLRKRESGKKISYMVMGQEKNTAHNDPRKKFPSSGKTPPPKKKLNGRPLKTMKF